MITFSPLGAFSGLMLGAGGWFLVAHLSARRPHLDERLAPYLRAPEQSSTEPEPRTPFTTAERLLAPIMADAIRFVDRVGSPNLAGRLTRAGRDHSIEQFRAEQVVAAVVGTGIGLALALALIAGRGASPILALGAVIGGAAAGLATRDLLLSQQIRRREERILLELPSVAELLALAVAAGEGAAGALERVANIAQGELTGELSRVVADAHSGTPLVTALERMADRTGVSALRRFAEAIAVAVERGTPLADVLHAQAADVREASRRELMEIGGRKEVAMMVPVVFLILPVTVVFAVFPGLAALRLDL